MAITPEGTSAIALENLRTLLASCEAWQVWTGKATVGEAATRIHLCDLPASVEATYGVDELASYMPYAIVDEFEMEDDRPGGGGLDLKRIGLGTFTGSGKIMVRFVSDISPEDADDPGAAKLRFMVNVGKVVDGMTDLGGGDSDNLSIHRITKWEPFKRSDETEVETKGDCYTVSYVVFWGV